MGNADGPNTAKLSKPSGTAATEGEQGALQQEHQHLLQVTSAWYRKNFPNT